MRIQIVSEDELKNKLVDKGYWHKITTGQYKTVFEKVDRSKQFKGGKSFYISYYDQDLYICTIHRVTDKRRRVRHEHPKHAIIDGVEYNT